MPVVLLNGQRISSMREMRNIPPEAIKRMEILPEEVALRFGYRPDQRVMNFILKDNFASRSVDAEYHVPTQGSWFVVMQPEHGEPSGRRLPSTKHQSPCPRSVAATGIPISSRNAAAASAVV